jgi:hypothetical protein
MTTERALDLALEALATEEYRLRQTGQSQVYPGIGFAITVIKQARAIDKKAENARELGLDYEPADNTQVSKVWWDGEKLMAKPIPLVDFYQPVQDSTCSETLRAQGKAYPRTCRKCGLGFCIGAPKQPPAAQRQWVGLKSDEIDFLYRISMDAVDSKGWGFLNHERFAEHIEAKLKEKNT